MKRKTSPENTNSALSNDLLDITNMDHPHLPPGDPNFLRFMGLSGNDELNDLTNVDEFLQSCVYYPCSHLSGLPVKFLGKRFQRFFYADYAVDREEFLRVTVLEGFKGYNIVRVTEISPVSMFGMPWNRFRSVYEDNYLHLPFDSCDPYMFHCRFRRQEEYGEDHGPDEFELVFCCSEGIAAYKAAFNRRGIVPKCLVHIRSGIGYGGNFQEYPQLLSRALTENRAGLPPFILFDDMGCDRDDGNYLDLTGIYREMQHWSFQYSEHLYFAELS